MPRPGIYYGYTIGWEQGCPNLVSVPCPTQPRGVIRSTRLETANVERDDPKFVYARLVLATGLCF